MSSERKFSGDGKVLYLDPASEAAVGVSAGQPGDRGLGAKLCRELLEARAGGQCSQLLIFRISNYDLLVDTFGRGFGKAAEDALMKKLRGIVRRREPVQQIRPGEFGIVGRGIRSEEALRAMASRMVDGGTGVYEIEGTPCRLKLEIGAAACPTDSEDPEELLRFARFALHQCDENSRSCCSFTDSALERQKRIFRMEAELQKAMEEHRFILQYQPQFCVSTGAVSGMEALVRMVLPDGTRVPPNEFIPLAEDNGAIVRLGYWIIGEACEQLACWRREGLAVPRISLNLSPRQLMDPGLLPVVEASVSLAGLEFSDLEFEITERCMLEDSEVVREILAALRSRGLRLAIDDFGTGYSSFAYLAWQPLDMVKLDRSFLARLDQDDRTSDVVVSMIQLAKRLGLELVAEGVENENQAAFLRDIGCDIAQGFALARPQDPEDIARLLEAGTAVPIGRACAGD